MGYRVNDTRYRYSAKLLAYSLYVAFTTILYSQKLIDQLSLVYVVSSTFLACPVSLYTENYVVANKYPRYLTLLIDLFSLFMITAYLSPNILGLITAWTAAELIGFILISVGEEHSIEGSTRASQNFLFISALTFELSIFTLTYMVITTLTYILGYVNSLEALITPYWVLSAKKISVPGLVASLLIIGFVAKAGLVPLHFWLPSAHTVAPSPASSLLSGVMTAMGIYGLLRIDSIISTEYASIMPILLTISAVSILYGGVQAHLQRDGKKLLAYSTIAGNGFAMAIYAYYIYSRELEVLIALITAVLAHMAYKVTLFLDIGLAEQLTGFRYIHRLRGLAASLPVSVMGGLMAFLSIIGIPPTTGFTSKLFSILLVVSKLYDPFVASVFVSIILFILFSIIIGLDYVKIYFGKPILVLKPYKRENISKVQQYCILVTGLANILFTLIIILFNRFTNYLVVYMLASPFILIVIYLVNNVMRREV